LTIITALNRSILNTTLRQKTTGNMMVTTGMLSILHDLNLILIKNNFTMELYLTVWKFFDFGSYKNQKFTCTGFD
jgi:hypothetical protein